MKVEPSARQRWMAVLARASGPEIAALLHGRAGGHSLLKGPESGTVMVEGRAGGTGVRFNVGEATVTRCVVQLASGRLGFAYALGRDRVKAEAAARADAFLQDGDSLLLDAVEALARKQAEARDLASRKAAATTVDFFTLVRAEG